MDFATHFAQHTKAYFDAIPAQVWSDFEDDLIPGETWDERNILRSSIIKYGFKNAALLDRANANPVYELEVSTRDYDSKLQETLTGADLALVIQLKVNDELQASRLLLVQLKRASFKGGRSRFDSLHEESGADYFGRNLHQAHKMLLFSTAPVYWFAMSSGLLLDGPSLAEYGSACSLQRLADSQSRTQSDISAPLFDHDPFLGITAFGKPVSSMSDDEFEEHIHYWSRYSPYTYRRWVYELDRKPLGSIKKELTEAEDQIPYQYCHALRSRLHDYADDNHGMASRLGLFVVAAENILSASTENKNTFAEIYPDSLPFTEFMLRNVLANDFGDPNTDTINAVLENDVEHFRKRAKKLEKIYDLRVADSFRNANVVKHAVVLTRQVTTHNVEDVEG